MCGGGFWGGSCQTVPGWVAFISETFVYSQNFKYTVKDTFLLQGDVYLFTNLEDAVQNAELVIEAIEEDLLAKINIFQSKIRN